MKIGIGVKCYNRCQNTIDCISSLLNNLPVIRVADTLELIIVDDYSTDDTVPRLVALREHSSRSFTILQHGKNHGSVINHNTVMEYFFNSKCDIVIVVEDDVRFLSPEWLYQYVDALSCGHLHKINFNFPINGSKIRDVSCGGREMLWSTCDHNRVLAMTYLYICDMGGFDPVFGTYGNGHIDYALRFRNSKYAKFHDGRPLSKGFVAVDLLGMEKYMTVANVPSSIPKSIIRSVHVPFAKNKLEEKKIKGYTEDNLYVLLQGHLEDCRTV